MSKSPFFWEDLQQARDRLNGTYILHREDVVLVEDIGLDADRKTPSASVRRLPTNVSEQIRLDDPGFGRFRKLPPSGWVNSLAYKTAFFLERRPVRRTSHGLNDNNMAVGQVMPGGTITFRDYRYRNIVADPAYKQAVVGDFPSLDETLVHVREDSTIAIDPLYAVHRDNAGVRWLLRRSKRVGLFPDNNSLVLLGKNSYLREELVAAKTVTVANIQAF